MRKNPGKYNYSSLGNGSASHLSMELLKNMTKTFMVHIPYNGAPPAAAALATGDAQASFLPAVVMQPFVQSGRIKILAVSTKERFPLTPEIPTVEESGGLKGFDSDGWNGILAPAGTPREIVMKLHDEIARRVLAPEERDKLIREGYEISGLGPDQYAAFLRADTAKWAKVIKTGNVKAE
jgi:tripartite-type tricarboxylate transporter receptor subunit TctC